MHPYCHQRIESSLGSKPIFVLNTWRATGIVLWPTTQTLPLSPPVAKLRCGCLSQSSYRNRRGDGEGEEGGGRGGRPPGNDFFQNVKGGHNTQTNQKCTASPPPKHRPKLPKTKKKTHCTVALEGQPDCTIHKRPTCPAHMLTKGRPNNQHIATDTHPCCNGPTNPVTPSGHQLATGWPACTRPACPAHMLASSDPNNTLPPTHTRAAMGQRTQ